LVKAPRAKEREEPIVEEPRRLELVEYLIDEAERLHTRLPFARSAVDPAHEHPPQVRARGRITFEVAPGRGAERDDV
jgi:hypothetical protein